jgi:hypothetical protein
MSKLINFSFESLKIYKRKMEGFKFLKKKLKISPMYIQFSIKLPNKEEAPHASSFSSFPPKTSQTQPKRTSKIHNYIIFLRLHVKSSSCYQLVLFLTLIQLVDARHWIESG